MRWPGRRGARILISTAESVDPMFVSQPAARLQTAILLLLLAGSTTAAATGRPPIELTFDASAAEAVLDGLEARRLGDSSRSDQAWARLLASEPYRRLHEREAAMGRAFTDESFRDFVLSAELEARAEALRRTLERWQAQDLEASARRVLGYLPPGATIRATVYPMIKPRPNSFVDALQSDPAIFLSIDPEQTAESFENTVAHELHHIGFASLEPDPALERLPARTRAAVRWMGAFGEGLAMLAAAGGVETHPHATSPAETRRRWDRDLAAVDRDLRILDGFFREILEGTLDDETILERARTFYGIQGPWYTVGYHMAVVIERAFGREALLDCMRDPRRLLRRYDDAVAAGGPGGARWSPTLLEAIDGSTTEPARQP